MPLTDIQAKVLRTIAANRGEESYLAGATVLHLAAKGNPVNPAPDASGFGSLVRHYGCVRGSWPSVWEEEEQGQGMK